MNMIKVRQSCPFDLTTWRSLKTMSEHLGAGWGEIWGMRRENVKGGNEDLGVFKMYFKTFIYVRPHRRQPTRLPRPWDSPGKNTGVGCHFLLQCRKVKSERELLSRVRCSATPWTAAYQVPPSTGFSRQEYWSGLPVPSPMHESKKWKRSRAVVFDSSDPMDCSLPGSSVHGIF